MTTEHWIPSFFVKHPQKGGELRSAQIGELLASKKIEIHVHKLSKAEIIFFSIIRILIHLQLPSFYLKNIEQFASNYKAWLKINKKTSSIDLKIIHWETTKDFKFAKILKQKHTQIIAYPHNIESVAKENNTLASKRILKQELKYLALVDRINVISIEDFNLLKRHKIHSDILFFEIPKKITNTLQHFKQKRMKLRQIPNSKFIVLGNASNPPTLKGMNTLIKLLNQINNKDLFFTFIGSKTVDLEKSSTITNAQFLGQVSNDTLFDLLINCTAAIIYQPKTSGYLTRIHVLQALNIPIIINQEYALLHPNIKNIKMYKNENDLYKLLVSQKQQFE